MRVIWLTSKLDFETAGGSVEETDYIVRNLQALGHEVTVITAFSSRDKIPGEVPYRVISAGFSSHRQLRMQYDAFRILKRYREQADAFIVDAHLFMYGAGVFRFLYDVPVAAFCNQFLTSWPQYRSSFFPESQPSLLNRFRKVVRLWIEMHIGMKIARSIDVFAFVNPNFRKMYEEYGLERSESDMIIGDPIDIKRLMEKAQVTEQSYRERIKDSAPITIFYSSRMSPGKGFDVLLQGFARVQNKDRFRLILGGKGPEEGYVRAMIDELHLGKYIELPGWVTKQQLLEYYKKADIFVQADWWPAGSSISLLYALAFGVPAILPGGGGLQWNAGEAALYFPYRDVNALAKRIEELGKNAALRAEMSAKCYERIKQPDVDYPSLIRDFAKRLEVASKKVS